jgi:hypothetical protein
MAGLAEPAVVIGNPIRTAIGAFNATLKDTPAIALGALVLGARRAQSRETLWIDPAALPCLGKVRLRQLRRPEDEAALRRFGAALTPEDLRTRFAVPTQWGPAVAERLWALNGGRGRSRDTLGPEVGRALLECIGRHAFEEGATELTATVLAENGAMLDLARRIGSDETGLAGTEVSMRLCLP